MIRITRQADYGIVLLGQFVTDSTPRTYTARDLSEQTHLPLPMVGKVLKLLVRNGFLESLRGVKGGYRLARPAGDICVAEIITALDGPIALTNCSTHSGECDYETTCPARTNWNVINMAVLKALRGITLQQMATQPTTCMQVPIMNREEVPT